MVYAMTDSLLFQIQMSEHNYYYVEENYMTIFPSLSAGPNKLFCSN